MTNSLHVVIMAGGTGTRFWPYSREIHPKQFLDILGTGKTLLQMTYDRFAAFIPIENIFVATNERHEALATEQLPKLKKDKLLLEPAKRNTAPCIAYSCYKITSKNPDATIVVAASDHVIFNEVAFQKAIQTACDVADDQKLMAIGIQPNRPASEYGYLKYLSDGNAVKQVLSFTEKPSKKTAQQFLHSGNYVWNAGIFVWSGKAIKNAFKEYLPEMNKLFKQMASSFYKPEEREVIKKKYLQCENISVDYGILEKSENVYVVLGNFDWADLGTWSSLYNYERKDDLGNVTRGEVMTYEVQNSLILSKEDKLVVVQGLDEYVVVDTEASLLICQRDNEAIFKKVILDMNTKQKNKFL